MTDFSDIRTADTTKLAYIGDAAYELFIRMKSIEEGGRKAGDMNRFSVHYVKADSQAKAAKKLAEGFYTDEETTLFKRARNKTNTSHPRGTTEVDYKNATGFEAVIGWLYVTGNRDRLKEIAEEAVRLIDER